MEPILRTTLKKRKKTELYISTYLLFEDNLFNLWVLVEGKTAKYEFEFSGIYVGLNTESSADARETARVIHTSIIDLNKKSAVLNFYLDYMDSASVDVNVPMLEGDTLTQMLEDTIFGRN